MGQGGSAEAVFGERGATRDHRKGKISGESQGAVEGALS